MSRARCSILTIVTLRIQYQYPLYKSQPRHGLTWRNPGFASPPPIWGGGYRQNFGYLSQGCKKIFISGGTFLFWGDLSHLAYLRGLESSLLKDILIPSWNPTTVDFDVFPLHISKIFACGASLSPQKTLRHDLQAYCLPKNHSLKVLGIVLSRLLFDLRYLSFSSGTKMLGDLHQTDGVIFQNTATSEQTIYVLLHIKLDQTSYGRPPNWFENFAGRHRLLPIRRICVFKTIDHHHIAKHARHWILVGKT